MSSVPTPLRFTAQAAQMLGPRGRRWLNKRLGLDTVFLNFDARRGRATSSARRPLRASSRVRVVDASSRRLRTVGRADRRPVGLDRVDPLEELVGRHLLISAVPTRIDVHELSVLR